MSKIHASLKSASEDKGDDGIAKSVPTFTVDPRRVKVIPGFNARPLDMAHVARLKELKRSGVDTGYYTLQMIDGEPCLRDGHHRHAADMELIAEGVEILRVKAMEWKGDEKAAILYMLATQSGMVYTPLQIGEQYVKLVNLFGMSYAEIAAQRGMSEQHVKDAIRLTEQPVELKSLITEGTVKASTALKLVKKEGATEAVKILKQAASTPGIKAGKGITQKVLDNLGHTVIEKAKGQRDAACEHLGAMLDSPGFDAQTKAALRDVLALVKGETDRIGLSPKRRAEVVDEFLNVEKSNAHDGVSVSAHLLSDVLHKRKLPDEGSKGATYYGHCVWLQKMAESGNGPRRRAAAHWFLAVLDAEHRGCDEVAPAPAVLPLRDALSAERESGGHVLAETLCPEDAALIAWARGRT